MTGFGADELRCVLKLFFDICIILIFVFYICFFSVWNVKEQGKGRISQLRDIVSIEAAR